MAYYTEEQIKKARSIDLLTYADIYVSLNSASLEQLEKNLASYEVLVYNVGVRKI